MALHNFSLHLHSTKSNGTHESCFEKFFNSTTFHNFENETEAAAIVIGKDLAHFLVMELEAYIEDNFHINVTGIVDQLA